MEIAPEINAQFELINQKEAFKLPNFTVIEATSVFKVLARIDWEAFRPDLNRVHEKDRKSKSGAKPFDVVLMFKVLVLQ
jgi:hypothetical protein